MLRILDEASQLRAYSRALETKSRSLEQATSDLRSANEKLKSLDRLKDDFMSSVTHELRTPLTSIRALAEILQDDAELPEEQRQRFIDIIVSETERLTRLVNQVLDMAKIESGHVDWHLDTIDMRALLEGAAATTAELFRTHGAVLELDLPDSMPPLQADPDRILQVVMNLLSNAAKFLPDSGGRVQLRARADGDGLKVCIQDNGAGVPAGQEELIFERFHQASSPVPGAPGTGLGLPISRHILAHFGGRLWLQPQDAPGACFCFWLPWQPTTSGDSAT